MPLIDVKVLADVFSAEQKREIIERPTDTMVDIESEYMRPVTVVTMEGVASGSWVSEATP